MGRRDWILRIGRHYGRTRGRTPLHSVLCNRERELCLWDLGHGADTTIPHFLLASSQTHHLASYTAWKPGTLDEYEIGGVPETTSLVASVR